MKYTRLLLLLCCVSGSFYMCKNASEKSASDIMTQEASTATTLNKETFLRAADAVQRGTAIDSNILKFSLPKTLMGMNRLSVISNMSDAGGNQISNSQVLYNKDDKTLKATIIDLSNNTTAIPTFAPWTKIQYQNTRADGYEKSIEEEGNKFFEKFDSASHESTLAVIYDQRILVTLSSSELSMADLHLLTK